jgi:hypothetical protein
MALNIPEMTRDMMRIAPKRKFMDFNLSCSSRCELDFTRHAGDPSTGWPESIEWHTVLVDGDECTESVELNRHGIRDTLIKAIQHQEEADAENMVDGLMGQWGAV